MKLYGLKEFLEIREKYGFEVVNSHPYFFRNFLIDSLYNVVNGLINQVKEINNFHERLIEVRNQPCEISQFYGFLTEAKIAQLLNAKYENKFELIKSKRKQPEPDFKVNNIFIEANTQVKSLPYKSLLETMLLSLYEKVGLNEQVWVQSNYFSGKAKFQNIETVVNIYNKILHQLHDNNNVKQNLLYVDRENRVNIKSDKIIEEDIDGDDFDSVINAITEAIECKYKDEKYSNDLAMKSK
jgi:hypothetical protein